MTEKKAEMSEAVNWRSEIAAIAGPFDGNRKSWLARAARRADLTYRQVKALYYGETDNPRHRVASNILTAAQKARIEEARRDASDIAEIYYRHAEALANVDPDFHGPEINALLEAARIIGGRDRT